LGFRGEADANGPEPFTPACYRCNTPVGGRR
jgi:hypothetical protein